MIMRRIRDLTLTLRTAGFLARRLWRPALYTAGVRLTRRR
jgi:hypothetical protein